MLYELTSGAMGDPVTLRLSCIPLWLTCIDKIHNKLLQLNFEKSPLCVRMKQLEFLVNVVLLIAENLLKIFLKFFLGTLVHCTYKGAQPTPLFRAKYLMCKMYS